MDTAEAANRLGTTPRILRAFLRSPMSTFVAVGSGARYEFTERDLPTLDKRFSDWRGCGKPKSNRVSPVAEAPQTKSIERDQATWADEEASGAIPELEDIRDPRIRARVKAAAREAEDRLMMLLMAKGLHVLQRGDRRIAS